MAKPPGVSTEDWVAAESVMVPLFCRAMPALTFRLLPASRASDVACALLIALATVKSCEASSVTLPVNPAMVVAETDAFVMASGTAEASVDVPPAVVICPEVAPVSWTVWRRR